jgi:hypothetical protein
MPEPPRSNNEFAMPEMQSVAQSYEAKKPMAAKYFEK